MTPELALPGVNPIVVDRGRRFGGGQPVESSQRLPLRLLAGTEAALLER